MAKESVSGPFSDLWALGIIIFELYTGTKPWKGTELEIYEQIKKVAIKYPEHIPSSGRELIAALTRRNPAERMGLREGGSWTDYADIKGMDFFSGINFNNIQTQKINYMSISDDIE